MSLFDDIIDDDISSGNKSFGPQEGFAGVIICASACDGHIGEEEGQTVNSILSQKKLYSRLSSQQMSSMLDKIIGLLKRKGHEELLEKSYPAVPPELRECVFANSVDIVLADGTVEQDERDFIDSLQNKLEINPKRAKKIVQVMVYKNHG